MAKKILLIDDDPALTAMYESRLASYGYEVVLAGNGKEGMEKVKTEKPDLIISDVLMPQMSGYQFLQALKGTDGGTPPPIIIISGKPSMKDFFPSWEIHSFLLKPFEADELLSVIEEAIGPAPIQTKAVKQPEVDARKAAGKRVLIAGMEDFLIGKIKTFLESKGMLVTVAGEENKAAEVALKEKPEFILIQFWEEQDKFDVLKIYNQLQGKPEMKGVSFVCLSSSRNGLEASKTVKKMPLIIHESSSDLINQVQDFIFSSAAK
ncbi:MAG TPA: response regulator [Candidatus Omnitrophota bacterium]|nr:response regulator [Candidatus Omnitrophota bacterium]